MSNAYQATVRPAPRVQLLRGNLHSGSPAGMAAAIGAIAIIAVALAWLEPVQTGRSFPRLIIVEAIVIALFALGPVVFRIGRRKHFDPFEPSVVFGIVYTFVFSVRPLFLLSPASNYSYELATEVYRYLAPSNASIALAMLYGLVGIVCFQIGYAHLFQKPAPDEDNRPQHWSSRRVTHIAILGIVMTFISALLLFPVIGSLSTLLANFGMVRGLLVGYGYQSVGIDLLPVIILIVFVDYLQGNRRPILIALVAVSNGYDFVIGSRAGVFNVWLFMLLAYNYLRGLHFTVRRAMLVGTVLMVTVIYSVSTADLRNTGLAAWSDIATTTHDLWSETPPGLMAARTLEEFNQVDVFATLVDIGPPTFPFEYGKTYLDLLLQPIPRMLWPSKPWSFDVEFGMFATGDRTAIPPSMVGEMYINFHIFGVIFGMLFFGWGCRRAYQALVSQPRTPSKILMYALLLPYVPIILTRSFVGAGTTIAVLGGFAWIAVKYISAEERRPVMTRHFSVSQ